jgi:hypothetical protein
VEEEYDRERTHRISHTAARTRLQESLVRNLVSPTDTTSVPFFKEFQTRSLSFRNSDEDFKGKDHVMINAYAGMLTADMAALWGAEVSREISDQELLERYVAERDEVAFVNLVRR